MNAPNELVSLAGLDLAVIPIESITLEPLQLPPRADEAGTTDPHADRPTLADIEVVVHDDPEVFDHWVEIRRRAQYPEGVTP